MWLLLSFFLVDSFSFFASSEELYVISLEFVFFVEQFNRILDNVVGYTSSIKFISYDWHTAKQLLLYRVQKREG